MIQKSKIQMAKGLCLFAGVALGAAVLTGCSSEDISSQAQGDGHPKVQVTATVLSADPQTATRADDGLNIASTGFSDNTKTVYIGVNKGSAGASEWTGYEFGISGTGTSQTLTAPVSGPEFPSGVTSVSVYGWYPYNNGNKTFTVLANQSTNANYNASDLMLANSATCSHDGSSVTAADLTFRHALTKMKVTVTPATGVTINSITLKSIKPQVTIDDTDKAALTVGSADGSATDITLFSGSSTAAVTQCAVFPGQEKAAGALLVVNASAGGGAATDVTYSLDGAKTFTADKQYVMNIALNATAVAAGSVTLTDWETASGTVTVNAGGGGGSLSLDQSTMTLVHGGVTGSLTISGSLKVNASGSAFTVSSSNTSIANFETTGTTVTVIPAGTGTATITVTDNNDNSNTASCSVTVNAANGINYDAVTDSHVGYVLTSSGKAYETAAAAEAESQFPIGYIVYVGSDAGCSHGLAIALSDLANAIWGGYNSGTHFSSPGKTTDNATACTDMVGSAHTSALATCGTHSDHDAAKACYDYAPTGLPAGAAFGAAHSWILAAGGQWKKIYDRITWATLQSTYGMSQSYYWSSTECNTYYAWYLHSGGLFYTYSTHYKSNSGGVRPVLAF